MIFDEGFLKKYVTLRKQDPSVYNLEELYFKVLPITLKSDGRLFLRETDLTDETHVTVNFPEFLDASKNLSLIKSIHFGVDLSLNNPEELKDNGGDSFRVLHAGKLLNSYFENHQEAYVGSKVLPLPPDLYRLYLGYRHVPVKDMYRHLEGTESIVTRQLAQMEDDCFTWTEVDPESGVKLTTSRTSVLKFKVIIDLDVLRAWINLQAPLEKRDAFFKLVDAKEGLNLNFILHPPYMGRMSFKTSVEILYPQRTTRLKMLDRITFKTNRSYVTNSKLYSIEIIDKETEQILFQFNTSDEPELFTLIKKPIKTKEINSYFDKDLITFEDSVAVDFAVPSQVQVALSQHQNFKIKIRAKDLTTHERG